MANKKISELTSIVTIADGDQMEIRDITAAASDQNKKVTISQLQDALGVGADITDNAIPRGDGGGRTLQDSGVLLDDSDNITGIVNLTATGILKGDEINADTIADEAGSGAPDAENGLIFSSNSVSGNKTSVTLEEYETGSFTPTVLGSTGSTTAYGQQEGIYERVGNVFFFYFEVRAVTTTVGGNITISGFPYTLISTPRRGNTPCRHNNALVWGNGGGSGGGLFLTTTAGAAPTVVNNDTFYGEGFAFLS